MWEVFVNYERSFWTTRLFLLFLESLTGNDILISLPVKVARNTVDHDRRDIAADQRTDIADEFILYICTFLIDPLSRDKALLIGDLMDILDFGVRLIRIIACTYENDHLSCITFVRSSKSGTADL